MDNEEVDLRMSFGCRRCEASLKAAFHRNRRIDRARDFLREYQGYCSRLCLSEGKQHEALIQEQRRAQEQEEYERQQQIEAEEHAQKTEEYFNRECPNCSETIKRKAKVCH